MIILVVNAVILLTVLTKSQKLKTIIRSQKGTAAVKHSSLGSELELH